MCRSGDEGVEGVRAMKRECLRECGFVTVCDRERNKESARVISENSNECS